MNQQHQTNSAIYKSIVMEYTLILGGGFLLSMLLSPLWTQNVYVVHSLFELVCILISASTFLLMWNTFEKTSAPSHYIGFGFLAVALFDLLHTYFFFGVRALNQGYPDLSTRYWVIGRLVEAVVLYATSARLTKRVPNKWFGLVFVIAAAGGIALTVFYVPDIMPVMMTKDGLTPSKIALEYLIIALTLISAYNLRNRLENNAVVSYRQVFMALILIVPAELLFTLFKVVTSFYSTYGHVLKIAYYYYLYKAVFVSAIIFPYDRLEIGHRRLAKKSEELRRLTIELKKKQRQEQLLTAQYLNEANKLKQLIELSPLAILMLDADGKVVIANKAFLNIFPTLPPDQIIGRSFKNITDIIDVEYEEAKIIKALRGQEVNQEYAEVASRLWLCNALPIRDSETDNITGAISIYHDVTEYERMREQMARFDRLSVVGQTAAGVAHEIRNPMAVVRGYMQFLMSRLGPDYSGHFRLMIEELDRANAIITDFLSLARNKPSEMKRQNLNDIIASIHPLIYGEAVKRGIHVRLNLTEDIPDLSLNDKEIKQMVLNFGRNAIEAMGEKGELTIETQKCDNGLQLIIADTGCGIPKDQLSKIFTPFYTTKESGTGLGLAVSLNIIRSHNATIDVESQENKGTKFTITFDTRASV